MKVDNKLVKLDGEKTSIDRTIISKILKLNEKNQYGYAMTNLLPLGASYNYAWKAIHTILMSQRCRKQAKISVEKKFSAQQRIFRVRL